MTRKKITYKTSRKDDLDPTKDQFLNKTMSIMDWTYAHRRPIALVIGLSLFSAIAAIVASKLQKNARDTDSALLGKGLDIAFAPVTPEGENQGSAIPKPSEPGQLSFRTASARASQMLGKYNELVEALGDSSAGLMSAVGVAAAYFDLGQYDKSVEAYKKFLDAENSNVQWLRPTAVEGLCYALEATNKLDAAKTELQKLTSDPSPAAARMARYHLARISEKQGDKDTAVKMLKEVIKAYTDKSDLDNLDYLFARARERLLGLDPGADVPELPGAGLKGLEGIDPALLRQLISSKAGGALN